MTVILSQSKQIVSLIERERERDRQRERERQRQRDRERERTNERSCASFNVSLRGKLYISVRKPNLPLKLKLFNYKGPLNFHNHNVRNKCKLTPKEVAAPTYVLNEK